MQSVLCGFENTTKAEDPRTVSSARGWRLSGVQRKQLFNQCPSPADDTDDATVVISVQLGIP